MNNPVRNASTLTCNVRNAAQTPAINGQGHAPHGCKLIAQLRVLIGIFIACFVLGTYAASAQTIHFNDRSKAPAEVLDKAEKGISQDINVILDSRAIDQRELEKRAARGLKYNNRELSDETRRELSELKAGTFPNGRRGRLLPDQFMDVLPYAHASHLSSRATKLSPRRLV